MRKFFPVHIPLFFVLLGMLTSAVDASQEPGEPAVSRPVTRDQPDDIIARVGDQPITLNQIDIMLNSSAMIGMSIPLPGTRSATGTGSPCWTRSSAPI